MADVKDMATKDSVDSSEEDGATTGTATSSEFLSGIYAHRQSSLGVLLAHPHIKEYMTNLLHIRIEDEREKFAGRYQGYQHYLAGFLEEGAKTVQRLMSSAAAAESTTTDEPPVAAEEDAKKEKQQLAKFTYTPENMVPVDEIDLMLWWALGQEPLYAEQVKACGDFIKTKAFSVDGTKKGPSTIGDFFPGCSRMPESTRKKKLSPYRLLKMINGSIYLHWRPEHEGFLFIDRSSQFWMASLSSAKKFKYDVPRGFGIWRMKEPDADQASVLGVICKAEEIANMFMKVRKYCEYVWNQVGDDVF